MATPDNLSGTDEIESSDLIAIWSSRNRDARRMSYGEFRDGIANSVENDLLIAVESANASAEIAQTAAETAAGTVAVAVDELRGEIDQTVADALATRAGVSTGVVPITPSGALGEVQIGRLGAAVTSVTDAFIGWQENTQPLNSTATAGSLLFSARNIPNTSINFATQNTLRGSFSSTGLQVVNGFGCNGKTPQAAVTVNAAATDAASTQALVNQLRALLIANGIAI